MLVLLPLWKTKYEYSCAPFGPVHTLATGETICVFCGVENPTAQHLETHDYSACAEKPPHKRSFYRKDHLRQHLRLFHKTVFNEKVMNGWVERHLDIQSRCGFCDLSMHSWSQRVDHLAAHFEDGENMRNWKGGYGFEPHVEAMVENKIPLDTLARSGMPQLLNSNAEDQSRLMPPPAAPALEGLDLPDDVGKVSDSFAVPMTQAEIDELVLVGLSCG